MPFALLIVGIILVVAAIRNTVSDNTTSGAKGLTTLVQGDFTGQNNFIYWMVAILVIGALGYIDSLKTFSRTMLVLILVALFLNGKQGSSFFTNFQSALSSLGSGNFGSSLSNPLGSTSTSSTSGTVSNEPISLGGLPATFSGPSNTDLNAMGIETPLASGRLIP